MERSLLFSGTLSLDLPVNRVDASDARVLPVNQEVFMHPTAKNSIIIEFLEALEASDDETAVRDHFEEISASNDCIAKEIISVEKMKLEECPLEKCTNALYLKGVNTIVEDGRSERILIDMVLFRLPAEFSIDLLLSYNNVESEHVQDWPDTILLDMAKTLKILNFDTLRV